MMVSFTGCIGDDDSSDDTDEKTILFTQSAINATSSDGKLTMNSQEDVFYFTDRPDRVSGHYTVEQFTSLWSGEDSTFAEDPPNAVLTWKSDDGSMSYAEVILTNAKVDNDGNIEYDFTLETGDSIPSNLSNVSLFIDNVPYNPTFLLL